MKMNYILCCSVAILACMLVKTNAQVCNADVVFMIDSSDNAASNNLFGSFNDALLSFVNQNYISDNGIRVGVVYYNNVQSRLIQLTGNSQSLRNQIFNSQILRGGVTHGVGLSAASQLFTIGARQFSPRIAVLVTPSRSRFGIIPTQQIAQLQNNRGRSSMTVYALGVPVSTNDDRFDVDELNQIATNNFVRVMANNLFQQFSIIAAAACPSVTTTANPLLANECNSCDFIEGVGYKSLPDCRKFLRCVPNPDNNNIFDVVISDCGDGLFWKQKTKSCVHYPDSDCYKNECDSDVPFTYPSATCGAYFVCSKRIVTHKCCPKDRPVFDPNSNTCVFGEPCQYNCEETNVQARDTGCQKTHKQKVNADGSIDRCKYVVIVGTAEFTMDCAQGTRYNSSTCSCTTINYDPCISALNLNRCSPDLDLDFSNNQVSDRASNYSVNNFGPVVVSGNSARFTGSQANRIAIPRFSNVDFLLPLAIRVRYRDEVSRSNMTVLSTGGCIARPGVYINAGNGRVTIGIVTESLGYSQPFESSLDTQGANSWKDVTLWYDGKTLAGYLRDLSTNTERPFPAVSVSSTTQYIKMVEGSLQLGYAYDTSNLQRFVGQIDMAKVWIGCKAITRPQDF